MHEVNLSLDARSRDAPGPMLVRAKLQGFAAACLVLAAHAEDCADWCTDSPGYPNQNCFKFDCLDCTACVSPPPPAPRTPPGCASWCAGHTGKGTDAWVCQQDGCRGCHPMCGPVVGGGSSARCASWCNPFTCDTDPCADCVSPTCPRPPPPPSPPLYPPPPSPHPPRPMPPPSTSPQPPPLPPPPSPSPDIPASHAAHVLVFDPPPSPPPPASLPQDVAAFVLPSLPSDNSDEVSWATLKRFGPGVLVAVVGCLIVLRGLVFSRVKDVAAPRHVAYSDYQPELLASDPDQAVESSVGISPRVVARMKEANHSDDDDVVGV